MSILDRKDITPADPGIPAVLERLQGNILKGHGRDHTVHIFFHFSGSPAQNKALLQVLMQQAPVTSAAQQLQDSAGAKAGGSKAQTFRNLFLTAKGYRQLGCDPLQLGEPAGSQVKFLNGMAAHQTDLADPAVAEWEVGYADVNGAPNARQIIDGMILLANDDVGVLQLDERNIRRMLNGKAEVLVTERGLALFNKDGSQNLEHFGYVDGRSQPTFLKADFDAETKKKDGTDIWDPREPLGLVLVPDPLAPDGEKAESFGSYFVFRKLEQNVKGFKEKEEAVAELLCFEGEEEELAGAMAVGRFEDGTPVVLRPIDGLAAPVPNNFRFITQDPQGLKCPFHAHIRKVNPRGDTGDDATERSHRIARRGITYGVRLIEPKDDPEPQETPEGGVGLLFMCFQANIDNQFAFMQRFWANNANFVTAGTGLDPVIGQPTGTIPVPQEWPTEWGEPDKAAHGFESFVTMLGGEFFFAPSLAFLRSL
jgi:Dyp-type peroxidase family